MKKMKTLVRLQFFMLVPGASENICMVNSTLIKHLIWRISRDDLSDNYNINNELLFASCCIRTGTVHETCTDSTVHLQPLNSQLPSCNFNTHRGSHGGNMDELTLRCCHTQLNEGGKAEEERRTERIHPEQTET